MKKLAAFFAPLALLPTLAGCLWQGGNAVSFGVIGGADGPTDVFVTTKAGHHRGCGCGGSAHRAAGAAF